MTKVGIIKFIDKYIGSLVILLLSMFAGKCDQPKLPHRILVIQLWGLGETVLCLPAMKALQKKFPSSSIEALSTERVYELFEHNKYVSKVHVVSLGLFSVTGFILKHYHKFDIVIDMEEYLNVSSIIAFFVGLFRVGFNHGARAKVYHKKVHYKDMQHCSETFLDLIRAVGGMYNLEELEKLPYQKKHKEKVDAFLEQCNVHQNEVLVGIAPGAAESAQSRMWPIQRYAELVEQVVAKHNNVRIIFVGIESEQGLIEAIQSHLTDAAEHRAISTAGVLNIHELFYLMTRLSLFIGNDSGPMHVAAAQGVKTVGMFGPNLPVRFAPYGKNNIPIYRGDNCSYSPCINVHKGEVPDCLYPKNSEDYQKCMKAIKVDDVLAAVKKLM